MTQSESKRAVAAIAEKGDLLDFQEKHGKSHSRQSLLRSALGGLGVYGSSGWVLIERPSLVMFGASVAAVGGAMGVEMARSARRYKREAEKQQGLHETARSGLEDFALDIVSTKEKEPVLHWQDPIGIESEHLKRIASTDVRAVANYAQDLGIDRVIVRHTEATEAYFGEDRVEYLDDWFTRNKRGKKRFDRLYNERVGAIEASAVELHMLANELEKQDHAEDMKVYVDILRVRGQSKVPELYDAYCAGQVEWRELMARIDYEFCLADQTTSVRRDVDVQTGRYDLIKESSYSVRRGVNLLHIANAHAADVSSRVMFGSVLGSVHVADEQELRESLTHLDGVNELAEQRARVALLLHTEQPALVDEIDSEESFPTLYDSIVSSEMSHFHPKHIRMLRRAGYVSLLAAAVMTGPGMINLENRLTTAESEYYQQYENQGLEYTTDHTFEEFLQAQNTITTTGIELKESRIDLSEKTANVLDPNRLGVGESTLDEGGNLVGGTIGDVERTGKPRTLFTVTPYNGAVSKGYWQSQTLETFDFQRYDYKSQPVQVGENPMFYSPRFAPTPEAGYTLKTLPLSARESVAAGEPVLKVDNPHITTSYASSENDVNNPFNYINLPVLRGMRPIAGNYILTNAKGNESVIIPLSMAPNDENEWFAYQPEPTLYGVGDFKWDTIGVTYWLGKDYNSVLKSRHEATVNFGGKVVGMPMAAKKTHDMLGDDPFATVKNKLYSLTPLADAGIDKPRDYDPSTMSDLDDLDAYGSLLASLDSANCNVATAQYMLATGGQSKDGDYLNAASGYFNNGDGKLTTSEAHMWTVDSRGNIYDPTPSTPRSGIAAHHEAASTINWSDAIRYSGASALIGGAGVFVYRQRRRPAQAAQALRKQAARLAYKQVDARPSGKDGALLGRLQQSLYARPGSSVSVAKRFGGDEVLRTLEQSTPMMPYAEAKALLGKLSLMDKIRLRKLTLAKRYMITKEI